MKDINSEEKGWSKKMMINQEEKRNDKKRE